MIFNFIYNVSFNKKLIHYNILVNELLLEMHYLIIIIILLNLYDWIVTQEKFIFHYI